MLFSKKTNAETSTMQDVKNAILTALGNEEPGSETYETLLNELERVEAMITKNPTWKFNPSADVVLSSTVTVVLAAFMIRHEQVSVFTSKVVGLMPKLMK